MSKRRPRERYIGFGTTVCVLLLLFGVLQPATFAAEARIAVAANFAAPAKAIGQLFRAQSSHSVEFSFGATGQLFAQISQGAPYDAFLAADQARPVRAVQAGLALPEGRFTYAIGRLALYSATPGVTLDQNTLRTTPFARLALANPATAPYGAAAVDVLRALGLHDALHRRLVQGNNVAQAFQFVSTGNAEFGFVALSQVKPLPHASYWLVPMELHRPIAQDAVLLKQGEDNAAAKAFLLFLKSEAATASITAFGYDRETN